MHGKTVPNSKYAFVVATTIEIELQRRARCWQENVSVVKYFVKYVARNFQKIRLLIVCIFRRNKYGITVHYTSKRIRVLQVNSVHYTTKLRGICVLLLHVQITRSLRLVHIKSFEFVE